MSLATLRRWVCAGAACAAALLAAGNANAVYVNRYSVTTNGGITFTGNTLGLNKVANQNNPGTAGSIGAFIAAGANTQVGSFPSTDGTTLNWSANGSTAQLTLPLSGTNTILHAELIWSGSYSYGGQSVLPSINNAVTFTTPAGSFSVSPAAATSQTLGTAGGSGTCTTTPCYYVRSANVTAQVLAGGAGTYRVGGVPATVSATENNNNTAGWTLAVVYGNPALPARNMTVFVGAELTNGTTSTAATVSGFCTAPTGPRSGRLMVSALEGDSGITGDQMQFGPTAATTVALSGPNNPLNNFFASQINRDNGTRDSGGSFGGYNQPAGTAAVGRQGYDISNVDVSASLVNSQTSATARGTSTGDQYVINALALQINVGAPSFPVTVKSVDKATTFVGDTLTYSVTLDNTTGTADATNVTFTDTPPPGTSFIAGSVTVGGASQPSFNPSTGFTLGTIAAGTSRTVTFRVRVDSIPAAPAVAEYRNAATWTYQYVPCVGQATVNGSITTNPVVTTVARLEPTKTVAPTGAVAPGQTLTYTIAVPNTGSANSAGTTLTDAIPAGTTYVLGSTTLNGLPVLDITGAMPYTNGRTISSPGEPAGQINAGETATVRFSVLVGAGASGSIVNTASIDVDGAGPVAPQTAQASTPVLRPDLVLSKTHSGYFAVGDPGSYTLAVSNAAGAAPVGAGPITVTDNLPNGLTVAAPPTGTNWDCSATVVGSGSASCTYSGAYPVAGGAALPPITLSVAVAPAAVPAVTNTASVSTVFGETVTANNNASDPTTVLVKPTVSKAFAPTTVLTNGVSTLTLTLTNSNGSALSALAVSDSFPPGLVVAPTPALANSCGGTVSGASAGSNSLALAGGSLAPNASCTISVAVTSAAAGSYNNTSGGVTAAETGTAGAPSNTALLTVIASTPQIAKAFAAAVIGVGERSTLTLTITNPGSITLTGISFTDTYPAGLVNAAPANVVNSCGGTVSGGTLGGNTIGLSGASVAGNASCSVSVEVTSASAGTYLNTTSVVQSSNGGSGNAASATLTVLVKPTLAKAFTPTRVAPGVASRLVLTVHNPNALALSGLAFSDSFPPGLVVAATPALVNTCGGSVGGANAGSGSLSLAGGSVAANASCEVSVAVSAALPGAYTNTSGGVSSLEAGPAVASSNSAILTVPAPPSIAKAFSPNPMGSGGSSLLTLTLTNPNASAIAGVAFDDIYPSGLLNALLPQVSNSCGGSVTGGLPLGDRIGLAGASLPANGSCTVSVRVTAAANGSYVNTTGAVTSADTGPGNSASATLTVAANPTISKAFSPSTIATGATSTLTLTLSNSFLTPLSGVAVTDTFPSGLVVAAAPALSNGCGGSVSGASAGSGSISLSGATLAGLSSCTLTIAVTAASPGGYANTTGPISSSQTGPAGTSNTAVLSVLTPPTIVKSFSPSSILAGGNTTLTLVIGNPNPTPLSGLAFNDGFPSGLRVSSLPTASNGCGGTLSGASAGSGAIALAGGALGPGANCTITVQVTSDTAGTLTNITGGVSSNEAPTGAGSNASILVVVAPDLRLTKSHSGNFTVGGTHRYTLLVDNLLGSGATGGTVTVTDTLPTGLSFVAASGSGWSCGAAGQTVTCTRGSAIAAGDSAPPIALDVAVAAIAVPAVTNQASVAGGSEPAANAGNNSAADFTVVEPAVQHSFAPDGAQTGAPGSVLAYAHVFNAGSAGAVSFAATNTPSPAIPGWVVLVLRDDDCNGVIDGTEGASPLTGSVAVAAGERVCIVVRDFIPANAPLNAQNAIAVTATFTPAGGGAAQTITRSDLTTVGAAGTSGLLLAKTVRNLTTGGAAGTSNVAASGQTLEYTVSYSNPGPASVSTIVINDATPAFTRFVSAACTLPLPASLSACVVSTQPAANAGGAIVWTLDGALAPGAGGSVSFRVTVQ
jgi:uncharacterized repeat protein (TIGR01451 family)